MKKQKYLVGKRQLNFATRFKKASQMAKSEYFEEITENMNILCKSFIQNQIANAGKSMQAWRFSLKDKITALALFQQGPSRYRLLSKIFAWPSRVTLTKLLQRIPIATGLCDAMLKGLEKIIATMPVIDRNCFLMFDEMSLSPSLNFNQHEGRVEGFEDFGDNGTTYIADHDQVKLFVSEIVKQWWNSQSEKQILKSKLNSTTNYY